MLNKKNQKHKDMILNVLLEINKCIKNSLKLNFDI